MDIFPTLSPLNPTHGLGHRQCHRDEACPFTSEDLQYKNANLQQWSEICYNKSTSERICKGVLWRKMTK